MAAESTQFTRTCVYCKPIDEIDAKQTIFTSKNFRVVLRADDQTWLGRCIIVPRKHINTFDQMTDKEIIELYECRKKVNKILKSKFQMFLYDNWAQLGSLTRDHRGNETTDMRYSHIHYSVFPIYSKPVEYLGRKFEDKQYDGISGHVKTVLAPEDLLKLREDLQSELIAHGLITLENLNDTKPSWDIMLKCPVDSLENSWVLAASGALGVALTIMGFIRSRM